MRVDDCYQLGYVIKTHGLKGEVQLFLDVDDSSQYKDLESMFILQGKTLIPFFLEHLQVNGKKALVKFEEVDSLESARLLVGKETYLPLDFLPDLPEGKYYYHQLVGLDILENGKAIGTATEVYEQGPQVLLAADHLGTEILIPVNDQIIEKVNLQEKTISVNLPKGLLDVFLSDDED